MDKIVYNTKGVCSRYVEIEIDDNKIISCKFFGGCSGNTQGICSLVKNMDINDVISKLEGIKCGFKSTSCPDQLTKALKEYKSKL